MVKLGVGKAMENERGFGAKGRHFIEKNTIQVHERRTNSPTGSRSTAPTTVAEKKKSK